MLVLKRGEGDRIVLDYGELTITLEVLETGRHHVRLGLTAPDDVRILRAELVAEDQEEAA